MTITTTITDIANIIAAKTTVDVEGLTERAATIKQNAVKKAAKEQVEEVIDLIVEKILAGDTVRISGLGAFTTPVRAGREGTNPLTGKPLSIPDARTVRFSATKSLKDAAKALPLDGASADSDAE